MHDAKALLTPEAASALARRGIHLDSALLSSLTSERARLATSLDEDRHTAKSLADSVKKASPTDRPALVDAARSQRALVSAREEDLRRVQQDLDALLMALPNLPLPEVPDGDSTKDAVEVRRSGEPLTPEVIRDHVEIAERLGLYDFARATALSGPRFSLATGLGARLERALASFLLDRHALEGYTEVAPPTLVTRQTMTGTGQLPKFEHDLFKAAGAERELYLIPTAEVPLTNMYAGEILAASDLPVALTAHTLCFRSEAGSYGRDVKGLIRVHQFSKVELVRICEPEEAPAQLELMLSHAEGALSALGLTWRTILLPAGDMGFSAEKTYDVEVWLPSQGWREISSCSSCGQFQARRMNMRMGEKRDRTFPATLNGSALPIGRTVVAILEQLSRPDGGVDMPEVLHPYLGFRSIAPDGTPER